MLSAIGTVFAVLLTFCFDPAQFTVVFWMLLFWGGAMVPTATGIAVSSVPKRQQNASGALGQLIYNIFGFFLAPNMSGIIMDQYTDKVEGLIVGVSFILYWNVFSVLFMLFALFYSLRQ